MLCTTPYRIGLESYGCGQCTACRINRRRLWCHRIMLEQRKHAHSAFVTLTYSDECLPEGGTLVPRHLTLFLKRLRRAIEPVALRYFAVGEYGDDSWRPHYHAAVFGIGQFSQSVIEKCWPMGYVLVGDLSQQSAQYIAGYVVKKLTNEHNDKLKGRYPEFARMSRNGGGGLGATAMQDVARTLNDKYGAQLIAREGDVPSRLLIGGRPFPIGRYLRRKLREQLGFETIGGQEKPKAIRAARLQEMSKGKGIGAVLDKENAVNAQKVIQVERKAQIWAKKGKL